MKILQFEPRQKSSEAPFPAKLLSSMTSGSTKCYIMKLDDEWKTFFTIKDFPKEHFIQCVQMYCMTKVKDIEMTTQEFRELYSKTKDLVDKTEVTIDELIRRLSLEDRMVWFRFSSLSHSVKKVKLDYLTGPDSPASPTMFPLIKTFYDTHIKA